MNITVNRLYTIAHLFTTPSRIALFVVIFMVVLVGLISHGIAGILFASIHVVLIVAVHFSLRLKDLNYGACILAAYIFLWWATNVFGGNDVRSDFRSDLSTSISTNNLPSVHYGGKHASPLEIAGAERDSTPWWFVDSYDSPCPFVVSLKYGFMNADGFGKGGRIYCIWVPGIRIFVYDRTNWIV